MSDRTTRSSGLQIAMPSHQRGRAAHATAIERTSRAFALTLAASAAALAALGAAAAPPSPAIDEWQVPWENTRPRDPYVGPSGEVWFVGQQGHYVAALDAESGQFQRIDLEPGTGPHNLIVNDDGAVWYAGNRARHIGRVDPTTGAIHKVMMPDPQAADPHTLVFDAAGDIWFTVQGGNFVGKLTVATESVDLIPVPTPGARPYGIVVAPDGTVWSCAFGTNKLLRIDPRTLTLTEVALSRETARPRRLEAASDGRIWYVDYADGMIGALDPGNGNIEEWRTPGGSASRPYGLVIDDDDLLWFVETGGSPNQLVGFDPEEAAFSAPADIPSGGGTVRHMHYHGATDTIWFGTDTNTIGRARLSAR
jgi:virginiamycin B lyase